MRNKWVGCAGILAIVLLLRLFGFPNGDKPKFDGAIGNENPVADSVPAVDSGGTLIEASNPRKISEAAAARNRLLKDFPDDYYNPTNRRPAYLRKLARHDTIQTFTTSSRRNDPRFRKIMVMLLENGYDLEQWSQVVGLLTSYHMPMILTQQGMKEAGYAEWEIEEALSSEYPGSPRERRQQARQSGHVYRAFELGPGIQGRELMDALLDIEITDIEKGEKILGDGWLANIPGDRLLTDEDWLDEGFREARARYKGPPRNSAPDEDEVFWYVDKEGNTRMIDPDGNERIIPPSNDGSPSDEMGQN